MSTSDESTVEPKRRIQFAFTDEQEQFRSAVRRFLKDRSPTTEVRRLMATPEGYDPAVWRQLSEDMALPGIHITEQYGGAGFGMVELCIVAEELGRALLCAPYFSTAVLAANAIMNSGTEAQKSALLPDVAKGAQLATLAITEPDGNWDPASIQLVATPEADGYRLDGVKSYVVDGHIADLLIVAARVPNTVGRDGLALFTLGPSPAAWSGIRLNRWILRARSRASIFAAHMRICWAASMTGRMQSFVLSIRRLLRSPMRWWAARRCSRIGSRLREAAGAVRADDRLVPGYQAQARRYAARRRAGQICCLLRGAGRRGQRSRRARVGQPGESFRVGNVPAYRDRMYPDSWRHRLHLGQRHASLVQAREKLRRYFSVCQVTTGNC